MKTKNIIFVFAIMFLTATSGYAQFFIEGSVSANFSEKENDGTTDKSSISYFGISPKAGYWLNDRWAIGAGLSYSRLAEEYSYTVITEYVNERLTPMLEFSVFSRYQLLRNGKWAVLAECSFDVGRETSETKNESVTGAKESMTTFGINVFPLITYDLTDRISLVAGCDFMKVGFASKTLKIEYPEMDNDNNTIIGNGNKIKETTNRFYFGAGSTVFNSLADISVGFIYNF